MANAIGAARQLYLTGKRRLLALPDALLQHAGEPLGEGTRIGRAVALEHARFVEQKMHRVFLEARLLAAQTRERHHTLMTRIDFENRLRGGAQPPRPGEHPFQRAVRANIGRHQTHRAVGEPLRRAFDIFNAICWSEFVLEFLPPKWRGLAAESSPGTNHLRSTGTTRSCCPA